MASELCFRLFGCGQACSWAKAYYKIAHEREHNKLVGHSTKSIGITATRPNPDDVLGEEIMRDIAKRGRNQ